MDISRMNQSQLETERRRLAKRANQRMLRLERAGLDQFAYKKAQAYLSMTGGRKRFYERKGGLGSINLERQEISKLQEFLGSVSSTRRGLQNKYKKAYETLKRKHEGLSDLSFSDYIEVLENWKEAKDSHSFGSISIFKTALEAKKEGLDIDDFMDVLKGLNEEKTQRFRKEGKVQPKISEKTIKGAIKVAKG